MAAYERVTLNRGGRNSRFDCTNKESNSFLVHSVFPDPLGPVTIIENGCLNVISFNGCDWSVYFPLPWTLRSCLCNASRLL